MAPHLLISDVADRAGISTATVRYYERVGVLPTPDRSANGYRTYDEHTVERLGFIGRAKQLGCTLGEIGDLVTAWEGGRCGPVQDQLRQLVADKLAATQSEIAALNTLSDDLRRAAGDLEAHRPDGPCDDRCGCLTEPPPSEPPPSEPVAIACTLTHDDAIQRVEEWSRLLDASTARLPISGGIRLEFNDTVDAAMVANLAQAEQACCPFFTFALTIDQRGVGLNITAPPDAQPVLGALLGSV